MPVERTVTLTRRWRRPKTETRWCYFFNELTIRKRLCYTSYEGVEEGTRYAWANWDWPLQWRNDLYNDYEWCGKGLLTPV